MNQLVLRLLAFLHLGVGEEIPPAEATPEENPPDDGGEETAPVESDEPTLEDLIETVEPTPTKKAPSADDDAASLRLRAERAERALAERQQAPIAPAAPGRDPDYDREEAQLAAARAKGDDTSWLEWQINSNRTLRENRRESQNALRAAQDLADRTEFGRLEITKPKVYRMYSERVEKTISDMRSRGEVIPPRMVLLRVFMGDDLLSGKLKPKQAKTAATPAATPQVPRGRSPNVRSDVTGKANSGSDHEKRRARLANVII